MELKEWVFRLFERNKLLIKLQRLCEQQQDGGAEGNSEDQQIKDWYPGNQIKVWWQQMTDEDAIWGQGTERGGNGAEQGEIRRRSSDRREGGRHKPLFLCRWSLKDSDRQLGCRLSLPVYTAHSEEGLLFFGGRSCKTLHESVAGCLITACRAAEVMYGDLISDWPAQIHHRGTDAWCLPAIRSRVCATCRSIKRYWEWRPSQRLCVLEHKQREEKHLKAEAEKNGNIHKHLQLMKSRRGPGYPMLIKKDYLVH